MKDSHLSTRLALITISCLVIVLSITNQDEYTFPTIGISVKGPVTWILLALLQIFFIAKGYLTGAVNGVLWPWTLFREGSLEGRRASELPEYWEVFFKQAVPIILSAISIVILAFQINKYFWG